MAWKYLVQPIGSIPWIVATSDDIDQEFKAQMESEAALETMELLDSQGADGWELVAVTGEMPNAVAFFKRRSEAPEPPPPMAP